jgi:hypothetical protein
VSLNILAQHENAPEKYFTLKNFFWPAELRLFSCFRVRNWCVYFLTKNIYLRQFRTLNADPSNLRSRAFFIIDGAPHNHKHV